MSRQTVNSTCNGLRAWYEQMKKPYPTDDDGRGLFTQWFEDGGFEEGEMQGEFDEKLDCAFLDLAINDDNDVNEFPFPDALSQSDDNKKQLFQLRIIRHCWEHGTAPNADGDWAEEEAKEYNLDSINYEAMNGSDTAATETTRKMFEKTCTKIQEKINEPDLLSLIAIGHKNQLPLATYLSDCFVRARVEKYVADKEKGLTNPQALTIGQWVRGNPYLQRVTKKYGDVVREKIESAIKSFGVRVVPLFQLDSFRPVIADDLSEIAAYFDAAIAFIQGELAPNYPMLFDFSIAVRECTQQDSKVLGMPFDDDGKDDDDDDDGDDDDGKDDKSYDVLQDIADRLKHSGTQFEKRKVDPEKYRGKYPRLLTDVFKAMTESQKMKNPVLPRGGRLCCLVDRRNKMTQFSHCDAADPGKDTFNEVSRRLKSDDQDEIYFFLPPQNCGTVDTQGGLLREVYFDRIKQCLIPNASYAKDQGKCSLLAHKKLTPKSQQLREAITCESTCNGGLLTFSFQMDAKDEIACYLIWNGKCIRFMPDDVHQILPLIFASNEKNKEFAASDKDYTGGKYEDKQFRVFSEKVNAN